MEMVKRNCLGVVFYTKMDIFQTFDDVIIYDHIPS